MRTNEPTGPSRVPVDAILPLLEAYGIEVIDQVNGYVVCPGIDLHSTPNAPHDCIAYNNHGIPYLHCLHKGCRAVRETLNAELHRAVHVAHSGRGRQNDAKAARQRQKRYDDARSRIAQEQRLAASSLPAILEEYAWPVSAVTASSPKEVASSVEDQWRGVLRLFPDGDTVWTGRDKYDSGSPGHRWRFRSAKRWLLEDTCPGVFTCPSAFQSGVHQRLAKHVLAPRFLVVESDDLTHDQIGAVFRWIDSALELPLRAVVDTGKTSLHGWFEYPPPRILEKLRLWLPEMGCDPSMFTSNQPCRLPGLKRPETGRYQRLLYLA